MNQRKRKTTNINGKIDEKAVGEKLTCL